MTVFVHDLRHGLRVLLNARGFTAAAVLSLAIGIGANSAIFSVTDALLLRPLPYPDAERLAIIWQRSPGLDVERDWLSIGQYLDIEAEQTSFERVAAAIGASFNVTGDGDPERVDGARVSSSLFPLLGARVVLGSAFTADNDKPGGQPSVILGHGFWQRRFGGDRAVVGKTITLNGNVVTIAGVMASDFAFDREVMPAVNAIRRVDLLLPLPVGPAARSNRGGEDYNIFGKLKSGVTLERAQVDMDRIARGMRERYPANYPPNGGLTLSVVPLIDQVLGDVRPALYLLLGAVGFVLLIACGNVANLLLSRAAVREKEIAIRSAMGAHRSRLVRQLLAESLLLAVLGGVAGLVLAFLGVEALRRFGPANIPRMAEVGIDARALAFTFAVAMVTSVIFGLLPALRASRVDPGLALREGGRGSSGTRGLGLGHSTLRKLMIAGEVALSLVLVIGAGLLIRSYQRITRADPGFDPNGVLSFRLTLPGRQYNKPELVSGFYQQLDQRLRALPGVTHVGTNYQLPLSSVSFAWEPIGIEGYVPPAAGNDLIISSSAYVSADYFRAMGMGLQRGRFFNDQDTRESPPVVIIDDKLAQRFWPGQDPVGKRLRQGADGPWRTVVGVVADTREYEVNAEPPITAFFPVEQYGIGSRFVVVRTSVQASTLTNAVLAEVRALDPQLPVYDVSTMETRLHDSLARRRLSMFLLATFAGCALVLAAIGIFGVIAFWVDQRTREIGIRVALGASSGNIVRLVARETLDMVVVGLVVGLASALLLTRLLEGMLYGVSATDVATFAILPPVLAVIALMAAYLPARRALRVSPVVAMRSD
jgi:predicted permease